MELRLSRSEDLEKVDRFYRDIEISFTPKCSTRQDLQYVFGPRFVHESTNPALVLSASPGTIDNVKSEAHAATSWSSDILASHRTSYRHLGVSASWLGSIHVVPHSRMCGELEYRISLSSIWTTALLYGIYVMLFAGSIYVLVWRRPNTRYLVATVTLFALATIYTAANFLAILLSPVISSSSFFKNDGIIPCDSPDNQAMFHEIFHELVLANAMEFLENCAATALLSVADGLLIYRCFVLWGSRKYIVTLPLVLLLATTVCNITGLYYNGALVVLQRSGSPSLESQEALGNRADLVTNIGIWFSLATNVITTFLSALRIWMMTRDIKIYISPGAAVKYYSAIAMVVESGALSSTSLLVNSIVQSIPEIDFAIASTINQQLLAIAPTLIIVRVGMGKGFDDVQDSLHATRVANDRTSASPRFLKGEHGLTSTISGMHFRTVEEAEPTTSRADHDGKDREDIPVPLKRERIALGDGAIV